LGGYIEMIWWFAIGYILMAILSIVSYCMGYYKYTKFEAEKRDKHFKKALLYFKMFFVFFIIGIIILFGGFLYRVL
jgi:accessory gene regulator protein AgrB